MAQMSEREHRNRAGEAIRRGFHLAGVFTALRAYSRQPTPATLKRLADEAKKIDEQGREVLGALSTAYLELYESDDDEGGDA